MLSLNGRHSIRAVIGRTKYSPCHQLWQLRPVSALLSRIDDPKRSSSVALIDAQNAGHIHGMTYGQLSEESIRMAGVLKTKMDPSVQSIGNHILLFVDPVLGSNLIRQHRIGICKFNFRL
jgi:hypothetical protein